MSFPLLFNLLLYPFLRLFTFFFLSPLFWGSRLPFLLKLAPTLVLTLLLSNTVTLPPPFTLFYILQELAFGYLLGFFIKVLFESALLAGELLGTFLGLSMDEAIGVETRSPLMGRCFLLLVTALAIAYDLHHPLLKLLSTKTDLPSLSKILSFSGQFFPLALQLVFIPLFIYLAFLLLLAIASKMLPGIPLFFLSPPLQLFLGVMALLMSLNHIPALFLRNFWMTLSSFL